MDLLSPVHIILLVVVVLLVFGPKKLPEIGAGLGRSVREFKQAMNGMDSGDTASKEVTANIVMKDDTVSKD